MTSTTTWVCIAIVSAMVVVFMSSLRVIQSTLLISKEYYDDCPGLKQPKMTAEEMTALSSTMMNHGNFPAMAPRPTTTTTTVPSSLCSTGSSSTTMNDVMDNTENKTFVSSNDILRIVQDYYWHESNQNPKYGPLARRLLYYATKRKEYLLTLQVGGMDGKSNDDIYNMFVRDNNKINDYNETGKLHYWLPLVVEPVQANFEKLTALYQDEYRKEHNVTCYALEQWAISYEPNAKEEGCKFCQFDVSDNAPEVCKGRADWQKYQIGTLDCEHSKRFFGDRFDTCIKQDPVPCGTVTHLLDKHELQISTAPIAFLQVDVEGYESVLIPSLLDELTYPPPVIHFEHKVIKDQDRKRNSTKLSDLFWTLDRHGYKVLSAQNTGDTLALRFDPRQEAAIRAIDEATIPDYTAAAGLSFHGYKK